MNMILLTLFAVYLPHTLRQNEILEELQVRGAAAVEFVGIRPYDTKEIKLPADDSLTKRLRIPVFAADYRHDTVSVLRIYPCLSYDYSRVSLLVQPVVKFGEDSLPPYRVFMELFSADYERAYLNYRTGGLSLFIGRERFSVGPSPRYNLLLSGCSAPMDWLHYSLRMEKVRLSFFLSRLNDLYDKPLEFIGDTITRYINAERYLTLKRLDLTVGDWLNLGLSEGTVFGGENYSLEIYHFNPVVFIQAYQYNWNKDVNFFLEFDTKLFFNNLGVYASLLLDDFQLEPDPNGEPNHTGFNIGFEAADPFAIRRTFWMIEYTAVSRYTYCHFIPFQRYQYLGTPIGAPFGPDYDELYTKFIYHMKPSVDIYTRLSYLRKGETEIEALWPIPECPRQEGTFFPKNNFLSGIVQKNSTIETGIRFYFNKYCSADVRIGYFHAENFRHERGRVENSFVGGCCFTLLYW